MISIADTPAQGPRRRSAPNCVISPHTMGSDRPVREAENRLERFNDERERLLAEVERRVVARRVAEARAGGAAVGRWRDLSRRLRTMAEPDKEEELRSLVRHYGRDVVGNFDPRVYRFATGVAPPLLGFVFSPVGSLREGVAAVRSLDARIQ